MSIRNLPKPPLEYDQAWADRLVDQIELQFREVDRPASEGWTITNDTIDRALDCDSTSVAEVADVLGTLIKDLVQRGLLSDQT
jgi:hypothetical protein|tara:strand:+ start:727 stop:975 length:249 start_codon:yes stop_codon:yes gene_type:complete